MLGYVNARIEGELCSSGGVFRDVHGLYFGLQKFNQFYTNLNFKNLRVFHNILISKRNTVYITRVYIHEVVIEIKCVMLGCNTVERGLDFIRPIRPR